MIISSNLVRTNLVHLLVCCVLLLCLSAARSQPALLSSDPGNGASAVPTNKVVVFTFNTAMDTGVSYTQFYYGGNTQVPVSSAWSAGNTVLTCTPIGGFPPATNIFWTVVGLSANNQFINPPPTGYFATGTGGGGLSLTNASYSAGVFSFNVLASPGQEVVVEYRTNLTAATWQTQLTTNSPGVNFSVSVSTAGVPAKFFRVRTGP